MHKHTLDYKMIVHESKLFQKKSVLLKSEKLFINVKAVKSLGKLSKKKITKIKIIIVIIFVEVEFQLTVKLNY